ncbi:MAG: dihydropteroate synthase [Planctomycetota bacterium]
MVTLSGPDGRALTVGGPRTRLMGILNVTPDSFFDGGRYDELDAAVAQGRALVDAGADVLDVGGESTRPGHDRVPADEQIRRVTPVIRALAQAVDVPISIDTTLGPVAAAALEAGASWVNDTTAFRQDPGLADVCAAHGCPVVLMHRFDPPRQDAAAPTGRALVRAVAAALAERVAFAVDRGIDRNRIVLDPGVGFGTLSSDNLAMHAFVDELRALDLPLLFGTSRKSFLGHVTGREVGDRLFATAASQACLALAGVEILRVHDVREMRDVVAIADAIRSAGRAP